MRPYLDNSAVFIKFLSRNSFSWPWMEESSICSDCICSYFEKGCRKKTCTRIAMPKGSMGYDQYTVPDTVVVEPAFVAFL